MILDERNSDCSLKDTHIPLVRLLSDEFPHGKTLAFYQPLQIVGPCTMYTIRMMEPYKTVSAQGDSSVSRFGQLKVPVIQALVAEPGETCSHPFWIILARGLHCNVTEVSLNEEEFFILEK